MNINDLANYVRPYVSTDVPDANVILATREAMIEFMRESQVGVEAIYGDAACGQEEVLLEPVDCHSVVTILSVHAAPCTRGVVPAWNPSWDAIEFFHDPHDGAHTTVWIGKTTKPRKIAARVVWAPRRMAACDVPDWVVDQYEPVIVAGALAILHSNPTDETANPRMALARASAFQQGVRDARRRAMVNHQPGNLPSPVNHFFRG